jgi:hypothetical protein
VDSICKRSPGKTKLPETFGGGDSKTSIGNEKKFYKVLDWMK